MQYRPTQQLETRQSILIDTYDVAHFVQSMLDPVLLPFTPGLYLPNQLEPVLRVGGSYWYEKTVFLEREIEAKVSPNIDVVQYGGYGVSSTIYGDQPVVKLHTTPWQYYRYEYVPVTNLHEVTLSPWDVIDVNPQFDPRPKRVLLPHHLASSASLQPTLPVVALQLIQQLVSNEIEGSRAYRTGRAATIEEILFPFLRPEYQAMQHLKDDRWFQETLSLVFDAMIPVLGPIRDQLRHNPYQMCSVHHHDGYQLRVEQLGDYRIMAWEQITADPEYQRWLQARANGDWDRYVSVQEEIIANNSAYLATSNPYR